MPARTTRARARVANAVRHHGDDPAAVAAARAELAAAADDDAAQAAAERIAATWPALSDDVRAQVAGLLAPAVAEVTTPRRRRAAS
jgi:hypothetical protein